MTTPTQSARSSRLPPQWSHADAEILHALASCPELLVASDYDGTLSPIVDNPALAAPNEQAVVALRELSELPHTEVAIISGRSLAQLGQFLGHLERAHMVGSHGSEFDPGFVSRLTQDQQDRLASIDRIIARAVESVPGSAIERKPASVCFHYRTAEASAGAAMARSIEAQAAALPDIYIKHGKAVIELTVIEANKGTALSILRSRLMPSRCLFIGDDRTDEDAFLALESHDIGIKVGPGETAADFAVENTDDVARFLAALAEARAKWLGGGGPAIPIERHSVLGNRQTLAVLEPDATIAWLCAPRIDSPAIFSSLLGGRRAGLWSIRPNSRGRDPVQRYHQDTMTLVTESDGLRITDCLDCSSPIQSRTGRLSLMRIIEPARATRVEFAPRLNFGRSPTGLMQRDQGLQVTGSHEMIFLHAPDVHWDIVRYGEHDTAYAILQPSDRPCIMELEFGPRDPAESSSDPLHRLQASGAEWSTWASSLRLPRHYHDAVRRSAITLRALTYEPTGAIAAAGTTSLPEWIGGVRNWDYRYCWPRDAAMAAASLVRLGSVREAVAFLDWLGRVLGRIVGPESLSPIYTVQGEEVPHEAVITELPGYAGSRPVRVGNAAAVQVQLDVFAPIVTLIETLAAQSCALQEWHIALTHDLAQAVCRRWQEPDHGIWEPRTPPRHNTHTKVMCWLTLDRAIRLSEAIGRAHDFDAFRPVRDAIRDDTLRNGWSEHLGAFSASYDAAELDAATLAVGLAGMLDPRDERFVRTVNRIDASLRLGPTVYRYFHEDGLPGNEGGFNLCTSWLIQALAAIGQHERAHALLRDYVALAGPTGLMSEEFDPRSGTSLGNFPQAYSHLGLIDAVLCL